MAGYICKIVIEDTHPPVWRRVVIPDKITFMELHEIIQTLFGWEDEHLHEFQISSDYITIGSEGAYRGKFYDEEETLIDSFVRNYKWISYIYDFGDDCRHKINIEKIDINYSLRVVTLLKYKGDNFEEDCGGVWGADETGHKVFQQECVNAKFATMKLMAHEELQEVPLLKESVEQLKELVHNLMQLKPEVLQSQLAKMAEDIHGEPSEMMVKISAWREFEEDRETKQLQVIPATKLQKELLLELGEKEATDYYKYLRIPQAGFCYKQELVEEISKTLQEHPEYLLYIFNEDEYREMSQWLKLIPGSKPAAPQNRNMVAKALGMGLADFAVSETGGTLSFATDAECLIGSISPKTRKRVYKVLDEFDDRVGKLIQVYGVMEMEGLYEIYKSLYVEEVGKEDFFRYIYWHAKFNAYVNTAYHLDGTCYISSTELDVQNILEKTEKYAKELPYAEFSLREISHMGEDLANRSEWIDIFVSTLHYQLEMDMREAQNWLYWVIPAIMNGDTLCRVLEVLEEQNREYWKLEVATELWMILSGLMLEFELPMLKGRSRKKYAEEKNCSPWSVGMTEVQTAYATTKDCPMHHFPVEIQEWMYEAVNFGVENCIIQLLDYKEQKHICSEEYLYLLTETCITFGYTKEAEKLLQQLKSGSVSGKRVAKQLKLRLQERYEVAEDEDNWWEMFGRNSTLQMPIQQPYIRENPKVGRNDPCPCGSGKKYKKCCGR